MREKCRPPVDPPLQDPADAVARGHANIFLPIEKAREGVPELPAIRIFNSGRVRNRFVAEGIEEYVKRISPFARIDIVSRGKGRRNVGHLPRGPKEGELVVALNAEGRGLTSEDLARMLGERDKITFLIGGPQGLSRELLEGSHLDISLSRMTFTSELAQLILLEQIYRALMILSNRPYHR
jgi:23S rRNA (pseudouridine1915-N3)-methyltransferase